MDDEAVIQYNEEYSIQNVQERQLSQTAGIEEEGMERKEGNNHRKENNQKRCHPMANPIAEQHKVRSTGKAMQHEKREIIETEPQIY